ncbi:MAG: phasin family protein [Hyphomicrobiaceae bacterium]
MFDKPSGDISAAIRDMAEKNVEQTRAAYEQFLGLAKQAQDLMGAAPADMRPTFVQLKAKQYGELNMDANFRLAAELAEAHDVTEYMEIQTRFAQTQALTLAQQTQTLTRLVAEAAKKAKK